MQMQKLFYLMMPTKDLADNFIKQVNLDFYIVFVYTNSVVIDLSVVLQGHVFYIGHLIFVNSTCRSYYHSTLPVSSLDFFNDLFTVYVSAFYLLVLQFL